jgi:hypothetical protein
MADKKQITRIYIFGYKFAITSEEVKKGEWKVIVSLGALKETYTDYVEDRANAEQACFGYFLTKHCQGGIFWQKPDKEDMKKLLAERINTSYFLHE